MLAHTHSPAAPATPSPLGVVGVAATYPEWCNDEARRLIRRIVRNRPEQTKPLYEGMAIYGFRGPHMNQLRQIYDGYFLARMDECSRLGHGSADYHVKRAALLAYDREHGPDALIERLLTDPEPVSAERSAFGMVRK